MGKIHRVFITAFSLVLCLSACLPANPPFDPNSQPAELSTPSPLASASLISLPSSTIAAPAPPRLPTTTRILPSPSVALVPTSTPTSAPTPSPVPVLVSPDTVNVPILLYHHVLDFTGSGQDYYVGITAFQNQMRRLKDWGYTTISISDLAGAIRNGSPLPERPIVLTFDDGNLDVYQNAFPVLSQYRFYAVMYIIVNSLNAKGNLSIPQVQELAAAGWEIGSHSYTHSNLLKSEALQKEICLSRYNLAKATGLEVKSFAYPFGLADHYLTQFARDCGYTSAAGLGPSIRQSADNLYYLNRLTVLGSWSLDEFSSHLPWQSP